MMNLTLPTNGAPIPQRLLCLISNVKLNKFFLGALLLASPFVLALYTLEHTGRAQLLALAALAVPAALLAWLVWKASQGCHRALQISALAIAIASIDLTPWVAADTTLGLTSIMLATLGWWRCKRHMLSSGAASSALIEALNAAPIVFTITLVVCLGNATQWH